MNIDRGGSLFWFFIAFAVSFGGYRLGIGTVSAPGSGFVPFGAGVLLGLLSLVYFFQARSREGAAPGEPLFRGKAWPKVALVCVALGVYAQAIPVVGYNVATFLLMTLLFFVAGQRKTWKVIASALATTVLTYYVFSKVLNLQFPPGPLGF